MNHNSIIYQIFPRNHSKEGTFKKIEEDLPRISSLGIDIIYLMPIHEIGQKERKGTYGSPYAIKDYFSISHDLGTLEDFKSLVSEIHKLGIKIILDMVFNHTAPDSILLEEHEDYYYHKDGKIINKVSKWTDIIDLETSKKETQDYLIKVM
jgi:glycosidase